MLFISVRVLPPQGLWIILRLTGEHGDNNSVNSLDISIENGMRGFILCEIENVSLLKDEHQNTFNMLLKLKQGKKTVDIFISFESYLYQVLI